MQSMNTFFRIAIVATYVLAGASLLLTLPFDAGTMLRRISLILLVVHALEVVFVYRHVRLYRGPLAISILLTLLFGLLHWKPLADARARGGDAA